MTANSGWTGALLDPMRQIGDPLADNVVAELFAGSQITAVNDLMRTLVANEFPEPASLPAGVRDYFEQTSALPDWADPKLIAAGEQLFWLYGPKLILLLPCYSLPFDYLGKNGVQVLALTTRLSSNPTRRIFETAQFLIDIMQAGGLTAPEGRGRRTIQKVRLMHAAIRRLAPAAPSWNVSYGLPINQEDLAGTLMSFSWVVLDGLGKLGVTLSSAEAESYLHCWNVAGHLLGIRPELIPSNIGSAEGLTAAIARRQFGPSPEGKAMTQALIHLMANTLPGDVFTHVAPLLIRYFLGKERASWLGIEEEKLAPLLAAPLRLLGIESNEVFQNSKAASRVAEHLGRAVIQAIVYVERGGNRPSFAIPAHLQEQWASGLF